MIPVELNPFELADLAIKHLEAISASAPAAPTEELTEALELWRRSLGNLRAAHSSCHHAHTALVTLSGQWLQEASERTAQAVVDTIPTIKAGGTND